MNLRFFPHLEHYIVDNSEVAIDIKTENSNRSAADNRAEIFPSFASFRLVLFQVCSVGRKKQNHEIIIRIIAWDDAG